MHGCPCRYQLTRHPIVLGRDKKDGFTIHKEATSLAFPKEVKTRIDDWTKASRSTSGRLFPYLDRVGVFLIEFGAFSKASYPPA
jgi:hypothetical protein